MSLLEQQNFLAKLYTNERLRRDFILEPQRIGHEYALTASEIMEISQVFHEEITFFAESLFRKRMNEAAKYLPLTKQILDHDFETLFREFSETYQPKTIKKHSEDANHFCLFIQKNESVEDILKDAAKYEAAKLKFFVEGGNFVFCRVHFDLTEISRKIARQQKSNYKNKTKIAVWIRLGKKIKHFVL
jgi:hypothetical protein